MFNNNTVYECVDALLVLALVDWIDAADVVSAVIKRSGPGNKDETRRLSLATIRELLSQGLMRPGLITETEFIAWPLTTSQAIRRIEEEWRGLAQGPIIGEICWFDLTEEGFRRARELTSPETAS